MSAEELADEARREGKRLGEIVDAAIRRLVREAIAGMPPNDDEDDSDDTVIEGREE